MKKTPQKSGIQTLIPYFLFGTIFAVLFKVNKKKKKKTLINIEGGKTLKFSKLHYPQLFVLHGMKNRLRVSYMVYIFSSINATFFLAKKMFLMFFLFTALIVSWASEIESLKFII